MSARGTSNPRLVIKYSSTFAASTVADPERGDLADGMISSDQWSFRGGTRGNAVPIVKITLERMGTAFPLLSYGENTYIRLKCILLSKKMFS